MKKILTFKEYNEFERVANNSKYKRNISFYNPMECWVLDLHRKKKETD